MAEFFSLGGGGGGREATNSQEYHHHHDQETTNSTHNWFLYKHHDQELSTYKGFELWQQQQQSHHNEEEQNYQILRNPIINPFGLDIGPSHDHHHHHHHETNMMMRSSTITISCQDCGNQAKKDCQHMRCRTCCKSRGFQCQTHVKSTWVPAAKRRERQQQLSSLQQQEKEDNNKSKRQKDDSYTGLEVANNFPSKVNSTAVFQRVRMSSIEENEDQIAYQAAVNINGHIFKGILYDQGDNHEYNYMNGGDHDSSSGGGDPVPRQYNLNITRTATSAANDAAVGGGGVASRWPRKDHHIF